MHTTTHTISQRRQILDWLQSGKEITPLDALNLFNCFRLGARIADLREEGYAIKTTFVTVASGKRVASYKLED